MRQIKWHEPGDYYKAEAEESGTAMRPWWLWLLPLLVMAGFVGVLLIMFVWRGKLPINDNLPASIAMVGGIGLCFGALPLMTSFVPAQVRFGNQGLERQSIHATMIRWEKCSWEEISELKLKKVRVAARRYRVLVVLLTNGNRWKLPVPKHVDAEDLREIARVNGVELEESDPDKQ
jgi:hypothetical protein